MLLAIFEFGIWSTTNLLGGTPITTGRTNGGQQNNQSYTIGTEAAQNILIDDQSDDVFEDDQERLQFLTEPLTVNGFDYPVGTQVQNEFVLTTNLIDANGDPIQIIVLRFDPFGGTGSNSQMSTTAYTLTAPVADGTTFTITGTSDRVTGTSAPTYSSFVCYAAGTLVQTDAGEVPIETLSVGDLVMTLDNGLQPIRWIGARSLSKAELQVNPHLQPIRIAAGAIAQNVPIRDLVVSPQHRIFVRSKIAQRMFDAPEVLVHAKHLLDLPGVEIAHDLQGVTYVHAMCDAHEIIVAEGAFAETLYTGPEAMKALTPEAVAEIAQVFGEVPYLDRPLARFTPKGRLSRQLVARHVRNEKPLLQAA